MGGGDVYPIVVKGLSVCSQTSYYDSCFDVNQLLTYTQVNLYLVKTNGTYSMMERNVNRWEHPERVCTLCRGKQWKEYTPCFHKRCL